MKISGDEFIRAITIQRVGQGQTAKTGKPNIKTPEPVEFSDTAHQIKRIQKELNDIPEVREDLVAELKAKIEAGEYNVSSEDIADLMIRRNNADNLR